MVAQSQSPITPIKQAKTCETCAQCGEEKPLHQFREDRRRADGKTNVCARCENVAYGARLRARPADVPIPATFGPTDAGVASVAQEIARQEPVIERASQEMAQEASLRSEGSRADMEEVTQPQVPIPWHDSVVALLKARAEAERAQIRKLDAALTYYQQKLELTELKLENLRLKAELAALRSGSEAQGKEASRGND